MPPVSRPTVSVAEGSVKVPASEPSARSAVRTTGKPPCGEAAGAGAAGCGAAAREPPPRRKPHEPQNTFVGELTCPHCGQATVGCVTGFGPALIGDAPAPPPPPCGAVGAEPGPMPAPMPPRPATGAATGPLPDPRDETFGTAEEPPAPARPPAPAMGAGTALSPRPGVCGLHAFGPVSR